MFKKWFPLALLAGLLFAFSACEDLGDRGLPEGDAAAPKITLEPAEADVYITEDLNGKTKAIAELTVEATTQDGGEISYQWYAESWEIDRQPAADPKDPPVITYENNFKFEGATDAAFTPDLLRGEDQEYEEGEYAFYVIVTNTNNNLIGKRTATVRSRMSYILIRDTDSPEYPTISKHPTSRETPYELGPNMTITPLTVTATIPESDGGKLEYKWYRSLDPAGSNGTVALGTGGESASFVPDFQDTPGTYYYYVVVTNTWIEKASSKFKSRPSYPARIEVIRVQTAVTPVITVQPKDASYFGSEPIAALTVDNNPVSDGGNITYQWYSNTTASTKDAMAISGATTKTLTFTTAPTVTTFYYAVVTNTNSQAVNKVSTATSRIAMISIMGTPAAENATVTVNVTDKKQYVRGFGGMSTPWSNAPDDTIKDVELMYSPEGLGYNMMRIMIMPNNTDINTTMQQLVTNQLSGDRDRSDYYELVKIVNKYNGYVLASPWSPPAAWKSNNSINGGGYLEPQYYQRYADYLREYCRHMRGAGAPIYAVSIQNEPNFKASYDGCEWDKEQMRDFLKQVGRFTTGQRGWGGGKEIPGVFIMMGESANNVNINEPALDDPVSRANFDLVGRHIYGDQTTNLWNNQYMKNADGSRAKEVWMTEHNINGGSATQYPADSGWDYVWKFMNDVDLTIRLNEENAFIWWTQKRFYSMIGDGDYNTIDGDVLPRGHGLSHYAKFAKEMWRVGVTVSGKNANNTTDLTIAPVGGTAQNSVNHTTFGNVDTVSVKITAFVSEDGKTISLVMFTPTNTSGGNGTDMGNVKIQLPNTFTAASAVAMRSTSSAYSQMESVALTSDRHSAVVNLPAGNILSVRFVSE